MTRRHCIRMLLSVDGPMSMREFIEVCGWPTKITRATINRMAEHGLLARTTNGRWDIKR